MEIFAYDGISAMDTPEEDSVPNTPRMGTMEQIEVLHAKLRCLQASLDQLHPKKSIRANGILSNGCREVAEALMDHPYWESSYMSQGLDEESSFPLGDQDLLRQPIISHQRVEGMSYMTPPATCLVDKLPPEILMYIFDLCLEVDAGSLDDAAGFGGSGAKRAPMLLCHVCGHWRRLATKTSSLWRSFSLILGTMPSSVAGLRAYMDLWLQSSELTDMSINLEIDPVTVCVFDRQLMDRLAEMLRRCRRLRLNVSDEMFCGVLSLSLPSLRTLEIRTSYLRRDVQALDLRAPNLKTLTILGPTMCRFTKDALPWAQLTEYRGMCWADLQRHLDIIRLSPNLERCTLCPFYELKRVGTVVLPTRMERLRDLHVVSYLGTSVGGFLGCVEVPAIEVLRLEIPEESPAYSHTGWPREGILDLLERSGGRLKKLELIGMDVEAGELVEAARKHGRLFGCETNVVVQPL